MVAPRRSRRVLALAAGLVLAAVAAEAVCRIDALFPGSAYDPERARAFFEARAAPQAAFEMRAYGRPDPLLSEADALPYVHPFVGWSNAATDALAVEMVAATSEPSDAHFDLLLLGGSVAGNLTSGGAPRLVEILEADPALAGRRVRIWSFARPSYRAPQPFHWCAWLLALGARPHAVLLVDGFNEVAMSLENARRGLHPAYPAFQYWSGLARGAELDPEFLERVADVRLARREQVAIARQAADLGLHRSALFTRLAERRLRSAHAVVQRAAQRLRDWQAERVRDDRALSGPRFTGDDRQAVEAALGLFESSSRALHEVCRARGIPCVQIVQPTLLDPGAKPATADEARQAVAIPEWSDAVALGYPLLRARAAALRAAGYEVHDATRAFAEVEEPLFVDVVHFDERGNVALVEWIAPRLLAALR
ncbi:MAG: hypothetical protein JNK02_15020 [Planctomycetes bacterium]|nr:hypothetical protein [Planctomycetota bacterium]